MTLQPHAYSSMWAITTVQRQGSRDDLPALTFYGKTVFAGQTLTGKGAEEQF